MSIIINYIKCIQKLSVRLGRRRQQRNHKSTAMLNRPALRKVRHLLAAVLILNHVPQTLACTAAQKEERAELELKIKTRTALDVPGMPPSLTSRIGS